MLALPGRSVVVDETHRLTATDNVVSQGDGLFSPDGLFSSGEQAAIWKLPQLNTKGQL
jgi:hypothetical protein